MVAVEEVPWSDGKRTLTKAYMLFLARWARRLSWKETAECFRTSWDKVFDAVEHVVAWGLEHRTLGQIRELGKKACVVLNPATPLEAIEYVLGDVDQILIMSVNPGFGGQSFIPHSVKKIAAVRALLDAAGSAAPIEVDGGIDLTTVESVVTAGARWLVAGNAVFGTSDAGKAARDLKTKAQSFAQ